MRVTEELPTIDDILKLRKNLQTMRVLCNHFLPCVVGKKRWKMQILAGKHVNDIATVSDEAFVLLVLENIWVDMMKISVDEYYRPKKGKRNRIMKTMKVQKIRMHILSRRMMIMISKETRLLLEDGQVHGVDLVDMEDGVLKD